MTNNLKHHFHSKTYSSFTEENAKYKLFYTKAQGPGYAPASEHTVDAAPSASVYKAQWQGQKSSGPDHSGCFPQ